MALSILTVCTGNVCRSPLAELLLAQGLAEAPVSVSSAGIGALVGERMPDPAQAIARELGVADPERHVARQLTADMIREADVILAMTLQHRRAVVELVPRASAKTFTLREFARIAAAVPAEQMEAAVRQGATPEERMRLAVEEIGFSRGEVPPAPSPDDEDVIDPYRRSDEVYRESAAQLTPAVARAVDLLRRAAS